MSTSWVCCDLPTAVAEAIARDTLDNLVGAEPVDEADRAAAFELLLSVDDHSEAVHDLLRRLAPLADPYPDAPVARALKHAR